MAEQLGEDIDGPPLSGPLLAGEPRLTDELQLTAEDAVRSSDRARVQQARARNSRWYLLWLLVGPGILAMLGENDGPSMISYTATGAAYGLGFFLPFILITFLMAIVCQELSLRVGAVSGRGTSSPEALNRAFAPGGFLHGYDLRPDLGRITAPTLILAGRHDWICAPEFSEEIHRLVPGSVLRIVENSSHSMRLDEPAGMIAAITGFVAGGA